MKVNRCHSGIVHHGYRETNNQRDHHLAQYPAILARVKQKGQAHIGDRNRNHDRDRHNLHVIHRRRSESHRGHAHVVHRCNPAAHEHATAEYGHPAHLSPARHEKCNQRCENRGQQGESYSRQMVANQNWQMECQHSHVMHAPDAGSQSNGSASKPRALHIPVAGRHSLDQRDCDIRRYHCNAERKRDQPVIVGTGHHQIHHKPSLRKPDILSRLGTIGWTSNLTMFSAGSSKEPCYPS